MSRRVKRFLGFVTGKTSLDLDRKSSLDADRSELDNDVIDALKSTRIASHGVTSKALPDVNQKEAKVKDRRVRGSLPRTPSVDHGDLADMITSTSTRSLNLIEGCGVKSTVKSILRKAHSCQEEQNPRLSDEVELTEDQKAELKQAFSMFEKTGKGRIQARDLGELLRCLGWNPSEQDLEEARHELELSARGTISFSEVEAYIARRGGIYYGNNAEEDIMVAFQVLDKTGSGKITVTDFRHFMTTMGERMTHEEVEELIACSTKDGRDYIEYKDLVHAVQNTPT